MSYVLCLMSYVLCLMSNVLRLMSYVLRLKSQFVLRHTLFPILLIPTIYQQALAFGSHDG
jgi:hypothetical protein